MMIRTRFAPSPTGFLHVGGVRTALYAWLYARHHQGECVLRIEDTDEARSTEASVDAILSGLQWLGIEFDRGPFFQSQRFEHYRRAVDKLLSEKKAYYCTCSKERLEALRETQLSAKQKPRYDGHCRELNRSPKPDESYVIRFKTPQTGQVVFEDQVYGLIFVENHELDDLILIRSDGYPTYNFAVVIDDAEMQITHVIRGDDHLSNTPRQIHLYQALGFALPTFAHLPMILGDDGKRLSKRHGAVSVLQFREAGILPHALLNYLVRLGWSHGDQEIFSLEEMISYFDLNHVNRGVSSFNYEKLYWLNHHYLKQTDPILLAQSMPDYLNILGLNKDNGPNLVEWVTVMADRSKTLLELAEQSRYFFETEVVIDPALAQKHFTAPILEIFKGLYQHFVLLDEWSVSTIDQAIRAICEAHQIGLGKVGQPLRVALTGGTQSPSLDKTLYLIGKEKTLYRLQAVLDADYGPKE